MTSVYAHNGSQSVSSELQFQLSTPVVSVLPRYCDEMRSTLCKGYGEAQSAMDDWQKVQLSLAVATMCGGSGPPPQGLEPWTNGRRITTPEVSCKHYSVAAVILRESWPDGSFVA